jgi:hypothetical protein
VVESKWSMKTVQTNNGFVWNSWIAGMSNDLSRFVEAPVCLGRAWLKVVYVVLRSIFVASVNNLAFTVFK